MTKQISFVLSTLFQQKEAISHLPLLTSPAHEQHDCKGNVPVRSAVTSATRCRARMYGCVSACVISRRTRSFRPVGNDPNKMETLDDLAIAVQ